jgi:Phage integrase, N-terminal SAM-like domain
LKEFAPRFLDGYARANRQKPSGIAAKETILNTHLIPLLGAKRLDAITNEGVQHLKHALRLKAPKTVNNVLTVLDVMLMIKEGRGMGSHRTVTRNNPVAADSEAFSGVLRFRRI